MTIDRSPFNRCVSCDNTIIHPLCNICLAKRMMVTVSEQDPVLAKSISGFHIDGETKCISCGGKTGLCAQCFSKDVYDFLVENNAAAARSFLGQFDYELRKAILKLS